MGLFILIYIAREIVINVGKTSDCPASYVVNIMQNLISINQLKNV